jgi:hypothetical protein
MGRTFGRTVGIPDNPPIPLGTAAGDVNSSFGFVKVFQSLRVSVKVNDVEVTGCPDINTSASSSRTRLAMFFFNAGNITPPPEPPVLPGRINDVLVQIRIQRSSNSTDKPQLLEVWADLGRCADPGCFGGPGPSPVSLGKIMLGQWATIEVDWNGDRQFNLRLNKKPTIVFDIPSEWGVYPVSSPGNTLGVANRIASCPADQRAVGFIDAEFENLFVKELPDL